MIRSSNSLTHPKIVLSVFFLLLGLCVILETVPVSLAAPQTQTERRADARKRAQERRALARNRRRTSSSAASKPKLITPYDTPGTQTYTSCIADAWQCTLFSPCINGTQSRSCYLKNFICLNAEGVRPQTTLTCSTAISSPPGDENAQFNLALVSYIGKAVTNAETMKKVTDAYSTDVQITERGYLDQMSAALFKYNGDLAQLQYLQKLSEGRNLTEDEKTQLFSLQRQMNNLVTTWNSASEKAYYLR